MGDGHFMRGLPFWAALATAVASRRPRKRGGVRGGRDRRDDRMAKIQREGLKTNSLKRQFGPVPASELRPVRRSPLHFSADFGRCGGEDYHSALAVPECTMSTVVG